MDDLFVGGPWVTDHSFVNARLQVMLGPTEGSLLYFPAGEYYRGSDEVIDAGAFLGVVSYCLAKGLKDNSSFASVSGRIPACDLFEVWLEHGTIEAFVSSQNKKRFGVDLSNNQSMLPIYCANVGPLARAEKLQ